MVFKGIKNGRKKCFWKINKLHSFQINKIYSLKNIKFTETIGIKFVTFLMGEPLKNFIIDFNILQINSLKKEDGLSFKI